MLKVITLSVIKQNVFILSVVIRNVIMLSVIKLNVVRSPSNSQMLY